MSMHARLFNRRVKIRPILRIDEYLKGKTVYLYIKQLRNEFVGAASLELKLRKDCRSCNNIPLSGH